MTVSDLLLRSASGYPEDLSEAGSDTWSGLVDLAKFEGLEGLLYCRCLQAGIEIPSRHLPQLQWSYRREAERNCVALTKLQGLLEATSSEGLDVLVLPGASLLPLYPNEGYRPMDDIDLLVRSSQLEAVCSFLRANGFESAQRHDGLFTGRDLTLDLHVDLVNGDRIQARAHAVRMDMGEVWESTRLQSTPGLTALVLGTEDAILYTALHSFRRLTWFVDFYLLLKSQLDWQAIECKALQGNSMKSVHYCLRYLEEHLPRPCQERRRRQLYHVWDGRRLSCSSVCQPPGPNRSGAKFSGLSVATAWPPRRRFFGSFCFPSGGPDAGFPPHSPCTHTFGLRTAGRAAAAARFSATGHTGKVSLTHST